MAKYLVTVKEVWAAYIEVEADSEEQAIELVRFQGEGEIVDTEYLETQETDSWEVEESA